jgi:predicted transcriptional regulator
MERRLTDLQLAIMKVLWDRGEASVVDVHEALRQQRKITESTVATLLGRMEERDLVGHREDGRRYLYRALIEESRVRESLVTDFVSRVQGLFAEDTPGLVSRLLSARDVKPEELAEVREIVDRMQREMQKREASK